MQRFSEFYSQIINLKSNSAMLLLWIPLKSQPLPASETMVMDILPIELYLLEIKIAIGRQFFMFVFLADTSPVIIVPAYFSL